MQNAGGIGTLLVLLRDVRPDLNFKAKKGGPQDGWGVVAEVYEAIIKAIAAASFVNTKGLWFTNATSFFSKADQRATVRTVAVSMGRPGLLVIRDLLVSLFCWVRCDASVGQLLTGTDYCV